MCFYPGFSVLVQVPSPLSTTYGRQFYVWIGECPSSHSCLHLRAVSAFDPGSRASAMRVHPMMSASIYSISRRILKCERSGVGLHELIEVLVR